MQTNKDCRWKKTTVPADLIERQSFTIYCVYGRSVIVDVSAVHFLLYMSLPASFTRLYLVCVHYWWIIFERLYCYNMYRIVHNTIVQNNRA
uniref:Transmembrane protein n=1 Tax=Pyxicephalus adspersus TaxID=30357 RepID=A0AAV2ZRN4_PYXAD|nr:TPA: hypothetical protein GDO54_017766 [Pyxicephalus adspersus]